MKSKVVSALLGIRRTFIGGFGTRLEKQARKGSRYMPHIGAKERARHAGKPDGAMHGKGPLA